MKMKSTNFAGFQFFFQFTQMFTNVSINIDTRVKKVAIAVSSGRNYFTRDFQNKETTIFADSLSIFIFCLQNPRHGEC